MPAKKFEIDADKCVQIDLPPDSQPVLELVFREGQKDTKLLFSFLSDGSRQEFVEVLVALMYEKEAYDDSD